MNGLEDVVHIHNGVLLSHNKEQIMPIAATWMNLETHTKLISQKEGQNTIRYHLYLESNI